MENKQKKATKYPLGYWFCVCTEPFERMAFYLGRSIILIFVTTAVVNGGLGLSESEGAIMQSNLTAFSYLGPMIGGIIMDRFIGARYATPIGMVIAGFGYLAGSMATSSTGVYIMIALVSLGLALYRPSGIMGRILKPDQMDSAFSIRYSITNIGATVGPLLVGVLYKDVFAHDGVFGFAPCFRIAAIVIWAGALFFVFGWRYMDDIGKKPFKQNLTDEEKAIEAKKTEEQKAAKKVPYTTIEKKRILAIILISCFAIIFWLFWYLCYLPVYYHWADNMNWTVLGYEVPATWFDALNGLFCVLTGPLTAKLWQKLAARPQGDLSMFKKIGIGIGLLGVGYIYFAVLDIARGDSQPTVLFLLIFLVILTVAEMFFSPLGYSFVSKYSPSRCLALMMAVWSFANFFAAKGYGYLYNFAFGGNFKFSSACIGVAVVAFISMVILFFLDKPLSSLVKKEEE